jgi:hypothetical protein
MLELVNLNIGQMICHHSMLRRKRTAGIVSRKEWEQATTDGAAARAFLEEPRFSFMRDYLVSAMSSIENQIVNNTIRDVTEELTINDRLKRIFFTPKKVAIDELAGSYKWVSKFYAEIKRVSTADKDIEHKVASGELELGNE